MVFLIKYWKQIVITILLICIVGIGMKYQYYKDASKHLIVTIQEKDDIIDKKNKEIESLVLSIEVKNKEIYEYIDLNKKIQKNKEEIQLKYSKAVARIKNNEKLQVNEKGVIDKPITIVNSGVPEEAR